MTTAQQEIEAESLAYLVCKRHGITSKSESYLVDYVNQNTTVGTLDLDAILKAAGQVETLLGIAAETLFEPKKQRGADEESDQTGRSDPSQLQLHFSSRYA
jgi:antirestriction protein ArdC